MITETNLFNGIRIEKNEFMIGINSKVEELIKLYGGYSFNKGLFRIHTYESYVKWTNIIEEYFLSSEGKYTLFGFDWMGRQYALNLENNNEIFLFDISVNKIYICDESLSSFFKNITLNPEDYFSETLFKEHNINLKFNESISHKIPLILGGEDVNSNMEVTDMEVDWGLVGQLHQKI